MVSITGNHDGTLGGRLHRQPGHRAFRGRPAHATWRSPSTTCCRPGMRSPAPWPPAACSRPSATATRTGEGQLVRVALSDVAFAMVGNLGKIAEAQICRRERPKDGNYLYGAFGRDFLTKDGRRVMIVALTLRQWTEPGRGDRARTRPSRPLEQHARRGPRRRRAIASRRARCSARSLKPWTIGRTLDEIREIFDRHGVCWGPYQTFMELVDGGPALLDRQPDVRGGRAAGDRHLPDGGLAARLRQVGARAGAPRPDCSASTPTRCSPRCSGSAMPRSAASTTRAWSRPRRPLPPESGASARATKGNGRDGVQPNPDELESRV